MGLEFKFPRPDLSLPDPNPIRTGTLLPGSRPRSIVRHDGLNIGNVIAP